MGIIVPLIRIPVSISTGTEAIILDEERKLTVVVRERERIILDLPIVVV